jgi:hypothetical protein
MFGYNSIQLLGEYREYDMLAGEVVRVHHKSREVDSPDDYDARVCDILPDGRLLVQRLGSGGDGDSGANSDDAMAQLSSEEISLRLLF